MIAFPPEGSPKMLSNLSILRFRGFRELRIPRLTRVNLFVGLNNAGKTSILEAAEILARGTLPSLWRSPRRRKEQAYEDLEPGETSRLRFGIDLSHLFFGHSLRRGSSFLLVSSGTPKLEVLCEIIEAEFDADTLSKATGEERGQVFLFRQLLPENSRDLLTLSFSSHAASHQIPLSAFQDTRALLRTSPLALASGELAPAVQFVGTESPDSQHLGALWDRVVLTPEEAGVVAALQIIEPSLERVAFLREDRLSSAAFLKLQGSEQRLPLGSVGDGLKRLLTLALHLVSSRGGYLLIDEIDTGLHYTVMADMWRLVIETARRLDVQVLSTTHSLDCVRALAWVQEKYPELAADVTLHRVEKDNPETVSYSAEELATAARHHIEVR
jgi:hypothetical protein